jgi:hypothetical protein
VLYVIAMATVVVVADVLIFRGHVWERLAANVGIILVFAAFLLGFRHRAWANVLVRAATTESRSTTEGTTAEVHPIETSPALWAAVQSRPC